MFLRVIRNLLIGLISFLCTIKTFTAIIFFSDDPYTFFMLKKEISIENKILVSSDEELENYIVIFSDENGIIGQDLYLLLMDTNFILSMLVALPLIIIVKKFTHRKK
ncbi:hypothetical protein [Vibrio nigripulchritudo]|uniref:hypothetical protein n=1 Tax=Vibrio nigripulchritudo TaxID=28173 RepID=UPI0003B1C033|nr:hypothetical protein [Vibrio nigripulchritudo]CCN69631.1 hypothetical protein VIBNISFn118_140033 [Vibrio nigripulchritudo SFn118]